MKRIHPIAGAIALTLIATFWLSTAVTELFAGMSAVVAVKTSVPWGLVLLIPALATVGSTGMLMGRRRKGPLVQAKSRRMPVIALNGLLILVPSALFLAARAGAGQFDTAFYTVQAVELVAGAVNITLLGLSFRDGLRLSGRLRRGAVH